MPMGVAAASNAHVLVIYMPVYLPALGGRSLSGHWWERWMDVRGEERASLRARIGRKNWTCKVRQIEDAHCQCTGNLQNSCMHFSILEWRGDGLYAHIFPISPLQHQAQAPDSRLGRWCFFWWCWLKISPHDIHHRAGPFRPPAVWDGLRLPAATFSLLSPHVCALDIWFVFPHTPQAQRTKREGGMCVCSQNKHCKIYVVS